MSFHSLYNSSETNDLFCRSFLVAGVHKTVETRHYLSFFYNMTDREHRRNNENGQIDLQFRINSAIIVSDLKYRPIPYHITTIKIISQWYTCFLVSAAIFMTSFNCIKPGLANSKCFI